ncbi:MAG: beta-galactosidase [Anaerolineaceae bacterium]|nr:beta-galactosidase [Anaerolineaceae bacterium]
MNLGVQYYRPPFPFSKYWKDDMLQIKDSGLNTVQLWLVWGWIESKPGQFIYDDFDQIIEFADQAGLQVVLSTIAAVHPYWIHREVPGSEMIDHMGHKVISSNRGEIHYGITPGGCFDHPGVWERMKTFLQTTAAHYKDLPNLHGWDAWNELRWNVQSDGLVCHCDHTLARFRQWLAYKYGGLTGLNAAWHRRYGCWEEVMPGKLPSRPYTEMMAFEHFLTWRADRHAIDRYKAIKEVDPDHVVTVHAARPSPLYNGSEFDQAVNRGNDWFMADEIDGVGTSSFPIWEGIDDAAFGVRIEFPRSAARGKELWLSEIQGGRSAQGFTVYDPVDAVSQQRWIWNGIASGADVLLFWCWRNEVFGRESGGFGFAGDDGLADERKAAMQQTSKLIEQHQALIGAYQPDEAEVGVLFSPQSYYLHWAQDGNANRIMDAMQGYLRALVRHSIPFRVVEEEHLDALEGLKVLFLPRVLVVDEHVAAKLQAWVEQGGTLVTESECGAFDSVGIYRYPEDRFTARMTGVKEVGRRNVKNERVSASLNGKTFDLGITQWMTPWETAKGEVLCADKDGALALKVPVGQGQVILGGAYFGQPYFEQWSPGFEDFVRAICLDAGYEPQIVVVDGTVAEKSFFYLKHGMADGKRMLFVFFPKDQDQVTLRFADGFLTGSQLHDLITGKVVDVVEGQVMLSAPPLRMLALVEG